MRAYYEKADEIGMGFNVYGRTGRLVAWLLHEEVAASLVAKLNQGDSHASVH